MGVSLMYCLFFHRYPGASSVVLVPEPEKPGNFGKAEGFSDVETTDAFIDAHATLADRGASHTALAEAERNSAAADVQVQAHPESG